MFSSQLLAVLRDKTRIGAELFVVYMSQEYHARAALLLDIMVVVHIPAREYSAVLGWTIPETVGKLGYLRRHGFVTRDEEYDQGWKLTRQGLVTRDMIRIMRGFNSWHQAVTEHPYRTSAANATK